MEFDRVLIIALKVFVVIFLVILLADFVLDPLRARVGNLLGEILFSLVVGLPATVTIVYFILQEAERITQEAKPRVNMKNYDSQIKHLRQIIDAISKTLPREALDRIEEIKRKCPQCGRKMPKGYKLCPNCGFDWR